MNSAYEYHVYIVAEDGDEYCKIGVSNNPHSRLEALRCGNARELMIHCTYPCPNRSAAFDLEREAHSALSEYREVGEWFSMSPDEAQEVIGPIWRRMLDGAKERKLFGGNQLLATAGPR